MDKIRLSLISEPGLSLKQELIPTEVNEHSVSGVQSLG